MLNPFSLARRAGARLRADQAGATAIEYALIAALVGLAMIAGIGDTKHGVAGAFKSVMDRVQGVLKG